MRNNLSLPIEKTVPVSNIENYAIYLYGKGGIGKTSFTSQFTDAIHFFYEPSGDDLSLFAREPEDWEEFLWFITEMEKQKSAGKLKFKTAVIDVIDICFKQVIEYVCVPMGVNWPPSDYGKTWNTVGEEFRKAMYRIKRIMGLVVVSHANEKSIERMDGAKYDTIVPTITNTGHQILTKFCGLQCYYKMNIDNRRTLVIRPNNECEAKIRMSNHFLYSDGSPIMEVPMGNSELEAWKNFNNAYNNKLKKPAQAVRNTSPEDTTIQRRQPSQQQTQPITIKRKVK